MSMFAAAMPAAKFTKIGDKHSGTVVEVRMVPVPDFGENGKPKGLQYDDAGEVILRPDVVLRDSAGKVAVVHTGGGLFFALGKALAEIGESDLEPGDALSIEYTGDGEAEQGLNPPKLYKIAIGKA